jgi:Uma2 family endonuclease
MKVKVGEYFSVGVRQVWLVYPGSRTVTVYDTANESVTLRDSDTLEAGSILPQFTLSLRDLFAELDRHG